MLFFNWLSVRNKTLFWGAALLLWAAAITGILWSKGYQPQSSRGFTDEEMIRLAINRTIQRMQVSPPKVIRVFSENGADIEYLAPAFLIPYKDVDHFLEENPNCCLVKKNGKKPIVVNVKGKVFYRDKSGAIHFSDIELHSWQYFPSGIRHLP